MKKILFTIISFILLINTINAAEVKNINLKWFDSTNKFEEAVKINDSYFVFSDYEIIKYFPTVKASEKRYQTRGYYYYYIDNNEKIYVFAYNENDEHEIRILDLDFNVLKSANIKMGDIKYYDHSNSKYTLIGLTGNPTTGYKAAYIELNENLEELKYKTYDVEGNFWYTGYKDGYHYFGMNGSDYGYKYDGNTFTKILKSSIPSGLTGLSFNQFINNNRDSRYSEFGEGITETTYNAIIAKFNPNYENTRMHAQIEKDGNNYVAVVQEDWENGYSGDKVIFYKKVLIYLDSNLNEKWRIEYPEVKTNYDLCDNYALRSNGIAVRSGNIVFATNETETQTAKIYNSNKKELLDISSYIINDIEYRPVYFDFSETGLMAIYNNDINMCSTKSTLNTIDPIYPVNKPGVNYKVKTLKSTAPTLVYYFDVFYHVYTTVVGNGNVSVNTTQADADDEVEFVITPAEGYVLGEVKVTDANGNVIVFTGNKFKMPSADVTIEAVFTKIPETGAFVSYVALALLFILAIMALIISNREKIHKIK